MSLWSLASRPIPDGFDGLIWLESAETQSDTAGQASDSLKPAPEAAFRLISAFAL
jgi:hypothetical protein